MYLTHYNLDSKPFQMSTDPNFLWLGEKHKEALATLKYAIVENKGILALTGDVGTGKTTLINALIQNLGDDVLVATIYDPGLEVLDFFNIVSFAFNMGRTFNRKGEFLIHFKRFLKQTRAKNKKVLLIIDEAQQITSELLEEIRLLSNLEDEYIRLLNIFFVGQNEFIDILNEYKNRAIRQRITIRYHIEPLTLIEVKTYIQHRLKTAGAKKPIFSSGAIQEIFSFSNGYPRLINIICDHALLSGFVREIIIINADIIKECKEELQLSSLNHLRDTHGPIDESESKPEDSVIQGEEQPKKRYIRFHSRAVLIGIGLLAVIGSLSGYVFYNKIKTEPRENLSLSQDVTSYPEQTEDENDLPTTVPAVPEKKTYPVPSTMEIGKTGTSRYFLVEDPEPKLFREVDTGKGKISASLPPDRIAGQADTQENTGGDEIAEASDAFFKTVPEESKIVKITPEKSNTTSPETNPVTVQKNTPDKDRAKPESLNKEDLSPQEEPPMDARATTIDSAPSDKRAVRVRDRFSDMGPKPEIADVLEKDKPPFKTPALHESQTAGVSVPEKKLEENKMVVPAKEFERKKVAVPVMQPEEKKSSVPAQNPEEKKAVVTAKQTQVGKVVGNGEQTTVAALRNEIKSEAGTGDRIAHADLTFRLNTFLDEYCRTYEREQLDKFAAFFTPDAMEKGKSFTSRLDQYRRTFKRIYAMDYRIDLKRYAIQEGTKVIRVEGIFHVRARLDENVKWRESSGPITMELLPHGGSFQIRRLDY